MAESFVAACLIGVILRTETLQCNKYERNSNNSTCSFQLLQLKPVTVEGRNVRKELGVYVYGWGQKSACCAQWKRLCEKDCRGRRLDEMRKQRRTTYLNIQARLLFLNELAGRIDSFNMKAKIEAVSIGKKEEAGTRIGNRVEYIAGYRAGEGNYLRS